MNSGWPYIVRREGGDTWSLHPSIKPPKHELTPHHPPISSSQAFVDQFIQNMIPQIISRLYKITAGQCLCFVASVLGDPAKNLIEIVVHGYRLYQKKQQKEQRNAHSQIPVRAHQPLIHLQQSQLLKWVPINSDACLTKYGFIDKNHFYIKNLGRVSSSEYDLFVLVACFIDSDSSPQEYRFYHAEVCNKSIEGILRIAKIQYGLSLCRIEVQ